MNDERDPRDVQPDPDAIPQPDAERAPGDESQQPAEEPATGDQRPLEPAEEFESQPSNITPDEDATAEWPVSDRAPEPEPSSSEPPPSEVENYSATPTSGGSPPPVAEPVPSEVEAYASQPATPTEETPAHSVPATEVGESTQCPRCGTENRPGLAFCRNCGQRLIAAGAPTVERPGTPEGTQACPRCGTHNRAGTAFCQNCGANLRTAETPPGYVPPAVPASAEPAAAAATAEEQRAHAILGPIVLLIGAIGLATAWLLPFPFGTGSLFDRGFGAAGYGVAFWNGYPDVSSGLANAAYFGFAAAAPILVLLLVVLAIAGIVKARPGRLQSIGVAIALIWSIGLVALFVAVEVLGGSAADLAGMLRNLTPGGIIFLLASLIVLIGTLTRFARS